MIRHLHLSLDRSCGPVVENTAGLIARTLASEREIAAHAGRPDHGLDGEVLEIAVAVTSDEHGPGTAENLAAHQPLAEAFRADWDLSGGANRVTITAATQRGASYGLFHVEDLLLSDGIPTQSETYTRVPWFVDRCGGILRFAQDVPPEFDSLDYAGWLARHSINVNGLHIGDTNLDAKGAASFAIDICGGGSSNPFFNFWSYENDREAVDRRITAWEDEEPGCVVETLPRTHSGTVIPVLSIFSSVGRREYRRHWQKQFDENPRLRRMVFTFGDWGAVHGDSCPHVGDLPIHRRVIRWLEEAASILREIHPDIKAIARTWYYPREFIASMIQETPSGIGIRQKEPAGIVLEHPRGWELEQDNYSDVMLAVYELSSRYGETYRSGTRRGVDFYPAVGMGDTDESIDPVIGIPTPFVAAAKMRRLYDLGMRNFAVWWGGLNYRAYSPNHEVIREMIWSPTADHREVISRIAARDFPEAPQEVLSFWHKVEEALVDWTYVNWKQQLETFVGRGRAPYKPPFLQPITQAFLTESVWCGMIRPNAELLVEPTRNAAATLQTAVEEASVTLARLEHGPSRARLLSQLGWTRLLSAFLWSESLVFEALALDSDHGAKTNRRSMSEIWTDDIEAGRRAIAAIRSIGRDDVKLSNRSQSSGQTIEQIQHKIDATEVLLKSAVGT
jgi:hypothetical protein